MEGQMGQEESSLHSRLPEICQHTSTSLCCRVSGKLEMAAVKQIGSALAGLPQSEGVRVVEVAVLKEK